MNMLGYVAREVVSELREKFPQYRARRTEHGQKGRQPDTQPVELWKKRGKAPTNVLLRFTREQTVVRVSSLSLSLSLSMNP